MTQFLEDARQFTPILLEGAYVTVQVAFLSLVLSTVLGLTLALMRMSSKPLFYVPAVTVITGLRGIPIIVHGSNCADPRIDIIPQNYQIGFVWEQYLATQLLSHGDVFERFPELKVVVCHCGGALDRWIKTDPHLSQKDRSKNLFFDTNAPELNFLEAAIRQRTPARMCFGTEVPGSGGAVRPETGRPGDDLVPIIGSFDFLSEEEKHAIFHHNPAHVCPGLGALAQG